MNTLFACLCLAVLPAAAPAAPHCSGLDSLAAMPRDLHITPHPLASDLFDRLDGNAPLFDPQACQRYARAGRRGLELRLREEAAGRQP